MNNQDLLTQLKQLFKNSCQHTSSWNHHGYTCITAADILNKKLDKKNPNIPNDVATLFYDNFGNKGYNYYGGCARVGNRTVIEVLQKLFALHPPSVKVVAEFIEYEIYDKCYKSLSKENIKQYIDIFVNNRLKYAHLFLDINGKLIDDSELINAILDNIDIDATIITKLIGCTSYYLAERLAAIIDKTTIELTQEMMVVACKNLPFAGKIVQALLSRGIQLCPVHLEYACSFYADPKSIDFVINAGKLEITSKHFKALIKSVTYNQQKFINYNYYRASADTIYSVMKS